MFNPEKINSKANNEVVTWRERRKERWMEGTSSWENIRFNGNFARCPEKSCYRLRSNSQFSCNNIKHVRGMDDDVQAAPAPSWNLLKHYNRFHFNARVVQFVIFTLPGEWREEKRTWNWIVCYHEEYMTTIINKSKRITIPVDAALWNI